MLRLNGDSGPIFVFSEGGIRARRTVSSQGAQDEKGGCYIDGSELIFDNRVPAYSIAKDIEDVVAIVS